jgi:hypothetical protein
MDPPCNAEVGTRHALPEEVAWSLGFRYKKSLIGIRVFGKEGEVRDIALARLEDHRHMSYTVILSIVRTYPRRSLRQGAQPLRQFHNDSRPVSSPPTIVRLLQKMT